MCEICSLLLPESSAILALEFIFLAVISVAFTTQFSGAHSLLQWTDQSKDKTGLVLEKKIDKTSSLLKQICPYFYWKIKIWGFCASETFFLFVPRGWLWLCTCDSVQLCGSQQRFAEFMVLFPYPASIALSVMVLGARKWTFDSWVRSVGMCLIIGVAVACRDIVGIWNKIKILPVWDIWRKKVILLLFFHGFTIVSLLLKCRNEWINLNPLSPGPGSFKHPGAGGVWHQLGLCLEITLVQGGLQKLLLKDIFSWKMRKISLWNSE